MTDHDDIDMARWSIKGRRGRWEVPDEDLEDAIRAMQKIVDDQTASTKDKRDARKVQSDAKAMLNRRRRGMSGGGTVTPPGE